MPPPTDTAELVLVELADDSSTVTIRLVNGWRRQIGPSALGVALVSALTAKFLHRLSTAFPPTEFDVRPPTAIPGSPREIDDVLRRAMRDLDEFRLALTELTAAESVVEDPGRHVTVTIKQGNIAGIDVDPEWIDRSRDVAVEHALGAALTSALTHNASTPARAMDGCPDLQTVLQAAGSKLGARSGGAAR